MNLTPFFQHDCSCCTFLGAASVAGQLVDYYQCGGSYIARTGHRPESNRSLSVSFLRMVAGSDPVWKRLVTEINR